MNVDLWIIFLTGLTVGGLTCLAVQGGLLASVIAEREKEIGSDSLKHSLYATTSFLVSKYIAYVILGFLLGSFGGALNISPKIQTLMQLLAGFYMVLVALNLLSIHPIFRYVVISPPRFLVRLVRNQSKSKDLFAPTLLGAMTIFIPCGTTLAMEALAISSANGLIGASIMAVFILGTMPLFLGIGLVTSLLGETYKGKFLKVAAILVIYLGISSVNGALVAFNSPVTLQSLGEKFPVSINLGGVSEDLNGVAANQNSVIEITSGGYLPNYLKVKVGQEVKLTIRNKGTFSCAAAFRIPSLGIGVNLGANDTKTISFIPQTRGKIPFSCSMGMYRGIIEVI